MDLNLTDGLCELIPCAKEKLFASCNRWYLMWAYTQFWIVVWNGVCLLNFTIQVVQF